jgi:uncharacterized protein YoxC
MSDMAYQFIGEMIVAVGVTGIVASVVIGLVWLFDTIGNIKKKLDAIADDVDLIRGDVDEIRNDARYVADVIEGQEREMEEAVTWDLEDAVELSDEVEA